jgi:hypothetical protein
MNFHNIMNNVLESWHKILIKLIILLFEEYGLKNIHYFKFYIKYFRGRIWQSAFLHFWFFLMCEKKMHRGIIQWRLTKCRLGLKTGANIHHISHCSLIWSLSEQPPSIMQISVWQVRLWDNRHSWPPPENITLYQMTFCN